MQIDKQNNERAPETEYRRREGKENLRSARNNAARRVTGHNHKRFQVRAILQRAPANKAANRRRHKIDHRDKCQDNIIEKTRFQIFFKPKIRSKSKRHKQSEGQ